MWTGSRESRRTVASWHLGCAQPKRLEQLVFNPLTGQWQVKFSEKVINQSAVAPNWGVVDPGSYHVTRASYLDRNGNLAHVSTENWTSFGVPHSNTTKRTIRRHGNVRVEEEQTVVRSSNPNAQKRQPNK